MIEVRRSAKTYLAMAVVFAIVPLVYFFYSYYIPHPRTDFTDETRYLFVRRGESLSKIATNLRDLGAISSTTDFVIFGKVFGHAARMKTGRYAVKSNYSIAKIMDMITRGEAAPFNVTIPEGITIAETGHLLENAVGMDLGDYLDVVKDPALMDSLEIEADNLEGFLAPSTYNFFYEENAATIVGKMIDHFYAVLPDSFEIKANKLGLTFYEAVTLASLIEKEAMLDSERPIIASVFLNRLRKRMRLECDPTVIYAMGGLDRPLLRKDLQYSSPYNTYRVFGLPPGPIANPGASSLEAAVNPSGEKYLYFVAKGDGSHEFSFTLRDHVNATRRIKRTRNSN